MSIINIQSISIFHQVDSFVKAILNQRLNFVNLDLDKITQELNRLHQPFFEIFDNDYWYSNTIHAFVGACHACFCGIPINIFTWNYSSIQQFLYHLQSYESFVRYGIVTEVNQEMSNRYELEQYVRQVLNKYSKSLVVFITLDYQPQLRERVSLEDFQDHVNNLRDLISNKKTCFKDLVGYAWAIEQGTEKGYHCHLWLAYDGSKRQTDFYIGRDIGEKWIKITDGLGGYHNSNNPDTKKLYQQQGRLGIGRIHRDNIHEIENAVATALYLTTPTKYDQFLAIKPSGMRTFGKGVLK